MEMLRQSQWRGLSGSPSAFETIFCWVIAGETACTSSFSVTSCHSSIVVGDDIHCVNFGSWRSHTVGQM